MTAEASRAEHRVAARAARRAVGHRDQRAHAASVSHHALAELPDLARCKRVGAYLATDGELDPEPLVESLRAAGVTIYLPSVTSGSEMRFVRWDADAELTVDQVGMAIPAMSDSGRPAEGLDVLLVPLVSVDTAGTRLGRGGGYYDRACAQRLDDASAPPYLVGLAHDCQVVDGSLAREPWDVPLDALVTETGARVWRPFRRRPG